MQLSYKKLATYTLYLYILSLYVLAYDPQLNIISKTLFLIVIGTYSLYLIKDKHISGGSIYIFAFTFAFYATLSALWSIEISYAFSRNITLYQVIILMLVIYNLVTTREDLDNIILCLFWGGALMCIYAIIYYGPGEILYRMQNGIRLGGEINQENGFGTYCVISFVIGIFQVMYKKKWLYIIPSVIALILSFGSGSRRSLLIAIIATGVLFAFKKGKVKIGKLLIYIAIFYIVILILSNLEYSGEIFTRFISLIDSFSEESDVVDGSFEGRMNMIELGLEKFKENPLFEYGTDQFASMYDDGTGFRRPSHNNFIEILVGYGLIGFGLFYGPIIVCMIRIFKKANMMDIHAKIIFVLYFIELVSHMATDVLINKFSYIYLSIIFILSNIIKKENINLHK